MHGCSAWCIGPCVVDKSFEECMLVSLGKKKLLPLIQASGNNVGTVKERRKERGVRRMERGERGERREERHTSYAF